MKQRNDPSSRNHSDPSDFESDPDAGLELGLDAVLPSEALTPPIQSKSLQWLLLGLGTFCFCLGLAASAFLWLTALPPVPECKRISPASPDMEQLYCAQQAAQSGELPELLAGLDLIEQWTPEHPLYREGQRWVAEWSESVLAIARQKWYRSDLKGASELIAQIPQSSPVYAEAQTELTSWQSEWNKGRKIFDDARLALKAQNWDAASQSIAELREQPVGYWRTQQAGVLSQQLRDEKQSRKLLADARKAAAPGKPEHLKAAIALLTKVNSETFTWQEAQGDLNRWSESLLRTGFQQWKALQLNDAIASAQSAAVSPALAREAKNLERLSQGRKLAVSTVSSWAPVPKHALNLMEAVAAVQAINPESRFYGTAQASLKSWQAQLDDLKQLQMAQIAASTGQHTALKTAIAQAQQVGVGRPRRVQAQTLVAHWTREVQRIEDRPILERAKTFAEIGTPAALRRAIAQASQIQLGRALRKDSQAHIYVWTKRIEVIEDQPILQEAQSLAERKKLREAIAVADRIQPGRALYEEARGEIRRWQAEIRAIQLAERRAREAAIAAQRAAERRRAAEAEAAELERKATEFPYDAQYESQYDDQSWDGSDAPMEYQPVEPLYPEPASELPPIELAPAEPEPQYIPEAESAAPHPSAWDEELPPS